MEIPGKEKERRARILEIFAGFYICVFAVAFMLLIPVFYVTETGCGCMHEVGVDQFPTIDITMRRTDSGEVIIIKHVMGDPIELSDYKIIISSRSNEGQEADLADLDGQLSAGEKIALTPDNNPELNTLDFKKDAAYQVEIYDKMENKRVYNRENIILE